MKLHHKLFLLLVILLPTQLSYFIFSDWALIKGLRIDLIAPVVYLTDILIIALLVSWFVDTGKKNYFLKSRANILISSFLLFFILINIYFANVWQIATFRWSKVLEFCLLIYYVRSQWGSVKDSLALCLLIALAYTSAIALGQFLLSRTIGGVLYFLGERTFTSATPGITLFNIKGSEFLRPYATFPHPNVLGGFGMVSLFLIAQAKKRLVKLLGIGTSSFLIIISISQNIWMATLVGTSAYLFGRHVKGLAKIIVAFSILVSFCLPFLGGFVKSLHLYESTRRRLDLSVYAMEIFADRPIFGVGLGNFITHLPSLNSWLLQPVHNIYLLALAEVGVVGFLVVTYFIFKALRKSQIDHQWFIFAALSGIIVVGISDHFWLTLQQGLILFAIVIGAATYDGKAKSS